MIKNKREMKKNIGVDIILLFLFIIAFISMYFDLSGKYRKRNLPINDISDVIEGKCFRYTKKGHIVSEINRCSDYDDYLEIPSSIDGVTITAIDDDALIDDYKYIKIPSSIISIGKASFTGNGLVGIINQSLLLNFDNNSIQNNTGVTFYSVLNPNLALLKCYKDGKATSCEKLNTKLEQITSVDTKDVDIKVVGNTNINTNSIDSLELNKNKYTIKGYKPFLDMIDYVIATPVNNVFEDGKIYSLDINLGYKPYLYEVDEQHITATVRLDKTVYREIISNISFVNIEDGLDFVVDKNDFQLKISGTNKNLESLTPDDIRVYIDLESLGEGEYELVPNVEFSNNFINYVELKPVHVTIIKKSN